MTRRPPEAPAGLNASRNDASTGPSVACSDPARNFWAPDVVKGGDPVELVFPPEQIRPHTSTPLSTVWLLLTTADSDELEPSWTAISTDARGQATRVLHIPARGTHLGAEELVADAEDD
jgi:hypothetical protein